MRSSLLTLLALAAPGWGWGQFVWLPQPVVVAPNSVLVSPDGVTHYYLVPGPVVTERVERYYFEGSLPPGHSTAGIASSRPIAPTVIRIVREYHYQDASPLSGQPAAKPAPEVTPSTEPPEPPTEADSLGEGSASDPEDPDSLQLPPPVNGNGGSGLLRMYPAPEKDAAEVLNPRELTKRFGRWFDSVLGEGFTSLQPESSDSSPEVDSPADPSTPLPL